ncbi:MAG: hypothetical protein OXF68_06075 [Gammaproteobacteria bacterium]|nr:hypothetical protein [Gammaproteobacteria bacterium]
MPMQQNRMPELNRARGVEERLSGRLQRRLLDELKMSDSDVRAWLEERESRPESITEIHRHVRSRS